MDKKSAIVAVGASIVIIGSLVYLLILPKAEPHDHNGHDHGASQQIAESPTLKEYKAIKGDAYDRAFVGAMIDHHQGAIDMSKLAATRAKHQQLKELAAEIIRTQNQEVTQLTAWQKQWRYADVTNDDVHRDHAMGSMEDIVAKLKSLSGDEFDKVFLKGMIDHHQQAVDMAKPALENAERQEVKNAATSIITSQTAEIERMKQWQKDWRY